MNTIEEKPVTRRELKEIMKELFAANNETFGKQLRKEIKEDIDFAVNELALVVNKNFIEIDKRFDRVDIKFEKIDERFEEMEQRFDRVDTKLEGMNHRIIGINSRIDDIAENYTRKSEYGKLVKKVEKLEAVGLH